MMLFSEFDSERVLISIVACFKKCYFSFLSLRGEYVFSPLVVLYLVRGRFSIIALALGALNQRSSTQAGVGKFTCCPSFAT